MSKADTDITQLFGWMAGRIITVAHLRPNYNTALHASISSDGQLSLVMHIHITPYITTNL